MIAFEVNAEREELRRTVRRFFEAESPESAVRRDMESPSGYDDSTWRRATAELGLAALALPEEYAGLGYGPLELGVVIEEAGRALWCAPLLSSAVLAGQALLLSGDEEAAGRWLPAIAAGELLATVAHDGTTTRACRLGHSWVLTGEQSVVLDGSTAGLVLVPAVADDGLRLFAVSADARGLGREDRLTVDLTRRMARLHLDDVVAIPVGRPGSGQQLLNEVLDRAAVALAVESVGVAQRLLELAVDYAKDRVQFGRPIGSFQAVKHTLVDVHVDVELARSVAWSALDAWATGSPDLPAQASLAKSFCTEVAVSAANRCTQVFGGIGFTWEHPAHLYLKRAKGSSLLFGTPAEHRRQLAERLRLINPGGVR
jgi:alkylation response protein AidB-like acyl-CoA dehydrogenase